MLFGIAGPTASGKTTVTEHIVSVYQAEHMRYSQILSEIAMERGLDPSDKATLQHLYVSLREERGEAWLSEVIAERAKAGSAEHLVIEGNRRQVDLETLAAVAQARHEDWVLIFIDASPNTRFKRYNSRLLRNGKTTITRAEFDVLEKNPAEDEVDDLRQYATKQGIYINTDQHSINEVKALVDTRLSARK